MPNTSHWLLKLLCAVSDNIGHCVHWCKFHGHTPNNANVNA